VKDLKTMFEMLYLSFTQPNLDERAVAAMIDQYKTNLMHEEEDPETYFSNEIEKILTGNHPRFKPLEVSDMDKVSTEKALDFIKQCVNPADYTFVFTGNIKINEMKELCARYIASIPNAPSMNNWVDPGLVRPEKMERSFFKGQDDKCVVDLYWYAQGASDFSENRRQTADVLEEYLNILLNDEIREKMAGVYSIFNIASVSVIPRGEYSLSVYFRCSPDRSMELTNAVYELLNKVVSEPLNQDVFNKAKETRFKQHKDSIQSNMYIAENFADSAVLYNTPLSRLNDIPAIIRAVNPENMQALCREMIASGPIQLVLYPDR
jgi:zinc protease